MNLITLRWEQTGDPERDPPLFGFPLPWAQWSQASSLHWNVAVLGLLLNVLTYSFVVAAIGEAVRARLPPVSKWGRRIGLVSLLVVSVLIGSFWLLGASSGWHRVVALLPTEHVTGVSLCMGSGCYIEH